MKRYKFKSVIIALAFLVLPFGCMELEVDIQSELTPENFPSKEADFVAFAGPIYANLNTAWFRWYWMSQELAGDMCWLTANGGNWFDGGRYYEMHMHSWTDQNRVVNEIWVYLQRGINNSNRVLSLFETLDSTPEVEKAIADIKVMRGLYYFMLIDAFGDVPLITEFGQPVGNRTPRAEVFSFITGEITDALPLLSEETGVSTYGRVHKWMAHALLGKLYLNAEVYTGTPMWDKAVENFDAIIVHARNTERFGLDLDFGSIFAPNNGPHIKDCIFPIYYDRFQTSSLEWARFWLWRHVRDRYNYTRSSGSIKALDWAYYNYDDPKDQRLDMWYAGPLYNPDGSPVLVHTTYVDLDNRYDGPTPNRDTIWHALTYPVEFRNTATFDTGNDHMGWATGYRCIKYYPDGENDRRQPNDVPLFRYADVLLSKAEAILRGATATLGDTPTDLVFEIRKRAGADPFNSVDLEIVYQERARELAFEGWRRTDMIRFGRFEESYGLKTNSDPNRRIFPIPYSEMILNPNWTQNPGY